MTLNSGTKLGPYEIQAQLGAGGMGEVYKARDTRLDRTVAIKVLPPPLSANPESRQRFEREAKAVSSLNHPHICTLHDIGRHGETDYIVMELLEGETLADRLAKGPMLTDQVLRFGMEIADALDKAHRKGVVHRDLKPGNIMLTKSGAKLMDFGLAKLRQAEPSADAGNLPTAATRDLGLTGAGMILGTPQYMAPEQLEGKEADARTDIFAFGAVLYEMSTGRKAFEGKSQASLISAIMSSEPPPISGLQPMTPLALENVVRRCLAKDPEQRWADAHDVALQLRWIAEAGSSLEFVAEAQPRPKHLERYIWIGVTAVLAAIALIAVIIGLGRAPEDQSAVHFLVHPPQGAILAENWLEKDPAISPDGRRLAFGAHSESGEKSIWVRALDKLDAERLPGTEGAFNFFWSPDSQSIAFLDVENHLRRIDVASRSVQTICDDASYGGGAWSPAGVVIFVHRNRLLYQVPAAGGTPSLLIPLDQSRQDFSHYNPQFLPDGRHFLFYVYSRDTQNNGTYVGSLESHETRRVLAHDSAALFAPPGYLLFVSEGTLLAQAFDAENLVATGEPAAVAAPVGRVDVEGFFSASQTGVLAFRPPSGSRLLMFDRKGSQIDSVATPAGSRNPELSRDGSWLAYEVLDPATGFRDIWTTDLSRGINSRLTRPGLGGSDPSWSPDASRIAFASSRQGPPEIYVADAKAAGEPERITQSQDCEDYPNSWSPDGRYLLLNRWCPGSVSDLWLLSVSGDSRPRPYVVGDANESGGQFSPDGRWVLYNSNKSGIFEIYVRPFPAGESEEQVSDGGGFDGRWRRDGRELFYLSPDRRMMSVQVNTKDGRLYYGRPQPLFQTESTGSFVGGERFNYAVFPDGQRFLITTDPGGLESKAIHVIRNWQALLKR